MNRSMIGLLDRSVDWINPLLRFKTSFRAGTANGDTKVRVRRRSTPTPSKRKANHMQHDLPAAIVQERRRTWHPNTYHAHESQLAVTASLPSSHATLALHAPLSCPLVNLCTLLSLPVQNVTGPTFPGIRPMYDSETTRGKNKHVCGRPTFSSQRALSLTMPRDGVLSEFRRKGSGLSGRARTPLSSPLARH